MAHLHRQAMKNCSICEPFNERSSTHYKMIGYTMHSAIELMSHYRQFRHPKVRRLLRAALREWHKLPIKKRITCDESSLYKSWNTPPKF